MKADDVVPIAKVETQPKRILLIEDETLTRVFFTEDLREAGFTVIETGRADDGWSMLSAGEPVDLIFSDIHLPGALNGLELALRIKKRFPRIPVILSTAYELPRVADGLGTFLTKPFRSLAAIALIRSALGCDEQT